MVKYTTGDTLVEHLLVSGITVESVNSNYILLLLPEQRHTVIASTMYFPQFQLLFNLHNLSAAVVLQCYPGTAAMLYSCIVLQ